MQHPSAPLHLQQPQKGSVCTCRVCRGLSLLLAQSRDAQSSSEEPTAVTPPYSWEGRVIQDLGGGGTYLKVDENGAHGTTSRWRGAAAGPGRGGTRTGRVAPEIGAPPPHAPRARGSRPPAHPSRAPAAAALAAAARLPRKQQAAAQARTGRGRAEQGAAREEPHCAGAVSPLLGSASRRDE